MDYGSEMIKWKVYILHSRRYLVLIIIKKGPKVSDEAIEAFLRQKHIKVHLFYN